MNLKDIWFNLFRRNESAEHIFWHNQFTKNESGAPKYTVYTDADSEEEEFMSAWIEKWREHFSYLSCGGCGCCANTYEFDAPQEAINELSNDLIELNQYAELHRPPRTGSPSSFREFNRSIEKSNTKGT